MTNATIKCHRSLSKHALLRSLAEMPKFSGLSCISASCAVCEATQIMISSQGRETLPTVDAYSQDTTTVPHRHGQELTGWNFPKAIQEFTCLFFYLKKKKSSVSGSAFSTRRDTQLISHLVKCLGRIHQE